MCILTIYIIPRCRASFCVAIAASASSSPSVSSFVRSIVSSLSEIVEEVVCFYNSRISRSIHTVFSLLFIVAFGGVALDTSSLPPFFGVSFYLVLLLAIGVRIRTQGQINSHYITFAELSTNTTVIISYAMLCYGCSFYISELLDISLIGIP